MRIRYSLLALTAAILALAAGARGDSVPMGQVAKELSTESILPLAGSVPQQLAKNILFAQAHASYGGPESLDLSIESVLRAIQIEAGAGWIVVGSSATDPIVWFSAETAVNPAATVSLTPSAINFGEVPVQTPEPEVWILMLLGLAGSIIWANLLAFKMRNLSNRSGLSCRFGTIQQL